MRAPDFWGPGRGSPMGGFLAAVLSPLGSIYGAVTASRARRPAAWQAPVPVICIGNAVAGGAGKTQVVIDLAARLKKKSKRVHVLTRGYGGRLTGTVQVDPAGHSSIDVGDEALLIANVAPVWRSADRVEGAKAAVAAGADIILMDDGFQNPSLAKTVSLLVIDGAYGFGNGKPMPAGPLREPVSSAFARADAAVVIGKEAAPLGLPATLMRFDAAVRPSQDAPVLGNRKVVAFAGIGQPGKFFETLRAAGAELIETRAFPDHHPFARSDLAPLTALAESEGAMLLTTTKDFVRLSDDLKSRVTPFPVDLAWDEPDALENFILERVGLD